MTKTKSPELMRVKMTKTISKSLEGGSYVSYQAGGLFLLDKSEAEKLIKEGAAIDPTAKKKEAK